MSIEIREILKKEEVKCRNKAIFLTKNEKIHGEVVITNKSVAFLIGEGKNGILVPIYEFLLEVRIVVINKYVHVYLKEDMWIFKFEKHRGWLETLSKVKSAKTKLPKSEVINDMAKLNVLRAIKKYDSYIENINKGY
ncbi:MAG: hypothetical protein RSE00_03395 [Clostridia bacterium]